jgi:hypothetical protein
MMEVQFILCLLPYMYRRELRVGLRFYSKLSSYFIRFSNFYRILGSEVRLLRTVLVVLGRVSILEW